MRPSRSPASSHVSPTDHPLVSPIHSLDVSQKENSWTCRGKSYFSATIGFETKFCGGSHFTYHTPDVACLTPVTVKYTLQSPSLGKITCLKIWSAIIFFLTEKVHFGTSNNLLPSPPPPRESSELWNTATQQENNPHKIKRIFQSYCFMVETCW